MLCILECGVWGLGFIIIINEHNLDQPQNVNM